MTVENILFSKSSIKTLYQPDKMSQYFIWPNN
jgi:hypothetical protein